MQFLDKLRAGVGHEKATGPHQTPPSATDPEIQAATSTAQPAHEMDAGLPDGMHPDKIHDAVPSPDVQLGIQKIEAVTLAWTKPWLVALLVKFVSFSMIFDGYIHD